MLARWYYQNQTGVVGPVSAAELKYLINVGTIAGSTLVRKGEEGPWLAAGKIQGLITGAGEGGNEDVSGPELTEWHFNLKGQNKAGARVVERPQGDDHRREASVRRFGLEARHGTVGPGLSGAGADGGVG